MVDYDKTFASRLFDKFNIFLMGLVIVVTLYPFYYITIVSLSNGNAVLRGEVSLWPIGFTLESYRLVFENPAVLRSLGNSLLYTTVGTAINLFMTVLCAFPLARPKFSGRKALTWIVTLTMFVSGGLIPLYLLIIRLGFIDSIWALVLPGAINVWYLFILRTAFQGIPEELYEASILDGANDFQQLYHIALPLSKAVLATLLLFYAVAIWNDYFNGLIFLNDRDKFPIQLVMRNIVILGNMDQTNEMGGASDFAAVEQTLKYATIMVSTLPILLVYPFVQRYFVQGVMIWRRQRITCSLAPGERSRLFAHRSHQLPHPQSSRRRSSPNYLDNRRLTHVTHHFTTSVHAGQFSSSIGFGRCRMCAGLSPYGAGRRRSCSRGRQGADRVRHYTR